MNFIEAYSQGRAQGGTGVRGFLTPLPLRCKILKIVQGFTEASPHNPIFF